MIPDFALPMQLIGGDPDKDIAVLQLQAPEEKLAELKPVSIGSSTNLQVGQKVCRLSMSRLFRRHIAPFPHCRRLTSSMAKGR